MDYTNSKPFPRQKKSQKEKTKQWRRECINAGEGLALWHHEGLRSSYYRKRTNYNLYSDILDQEDIESTCNPLGLSGLTSPARMQNYPISNPKIDVLVGEEIKRSFDWKIRVINDDAVSRKEDELLGKFEEMMTRHIQGAGSEEQIEEELRGFDRFKNYEFQDMHERASTHIMTYLWQHQKMDYKFSKGFKDALIVSEEMYQCDIVAGEPVFERLNPLNVFTVRSGESTYVEDADIIVIIGYMSPGQIIDHYHEYLKPREIDFIESGMVGNSSSEKGIDIGRKPELTLTVDSAIDIAVLEGNLNYGSSIDLNGNIKVTKVYWRSMRKVLEITSFDEFGDEQVDLHDEGYPVDKDAGETSKVLWINEWWEGHKIGGDSIGDEAQSVYVRMQVKEVQFRSMENPSKCHPGIIGTIYNTNDNYGVSLMDRMKPYQYLYNSLAYNTELMIAKNHGKIMRLNLNEIPDGWDIEQWLSYATTMNIAVYDPFNEGKKGAAQGKLAGAMPASAPIIDMEMGNTIQLYMNMMVFIKQEMGEISGVSPARQGQISTKEAVGNVEREVIQSSHITEYWFQEHEQTKLRAMSCMLEVAKHAWKDKKNKKVQYILDDESMAIFEINGIDFNACEYGLQITNGKNSGELLNALRQLSHAGIQNDKLTYSQLLDIYTTDSVSSIKRKIERGEMDKLERDEQAQKDLIKQEQEKLAHLERLAEGEKDFKREEWDRDDLRSEKERDTDMAIERMRQDNETSRYFQGEANNPQEALDKLKLDKENSKKKFTLEEKKIEETIRHNKATEKKATSA